MYQLRELLGVPPTYRAARDTYYCLKKTPKLKDPDYNELENPMKWKEVLQDKTVNQCPRLFNSFQLISKIMILIL